MLTFYGSRTGGPVVVDQSGEIPSGINWIDALNRRQKK